MRKRNVLLVATFAALVAAAGAAPLAAQVCDTPVSPCPTGAKCDRLPALTCEICGDDGPDSLCGTGGNDVICSFGGADTIIGGSGVDAICPGTGPDVIDGQSGIDVYQCTDTCTASLASRICGSGACLSAAMDGTTCDNLCNIENLTGSPGNDLLIGSSGRNILKGGFGTGADDLRGGGGNDELYGENGKDTLSGDAGADLLDGGSGIDTASYASSPVGVDCDLTRTRDHCLPDGDDLTLIENLTGSPFRDALWGDAGNNTLSGGAGNDVLVGRDGTDTCDGGPGQDICECENRINCEVIEPPGHCDTIGCPPVP